MKTADRLPSKLTVGFFKDRTLHAETEMNGRIAVQRWIQGIQQLGFFNLIEVCRPKVIHLWPLSALPRWIFQSVQLRCIQLSHNDMALREILILFSSARVAELTRRDEVLPVESQPEITGMHDLVCG